MGFVEGRVYVPNMWLVLRKTHYIASNIELKKSYYSMNSKLHIKNFNETEKRYVGFVEARE